MRYIAYTDGSYLNDPKYGPHYGWAAIVYPENNFDNIDQLTGSGNDASYIQHHNVAGEIMAVMALCRHCMDVLHLGRDDVLEINHDYEGVANWCKRADEAGFWKAKKPLTMAYRQFMNSGPKTMFKVEFRHTKGHSGNVGNDIVDRLAKQAIYDKFNKMSELKS